MVVINIHYNLHTETYILGSQDVLNQLIQNFPEKLTEYIPNELWESENFIISTEVSFLIKENIPELITYLKKQIE